MGAHTRFVPPQHRSAVEAEIEMHLQRVTLLLARLDRWDGDCDLEDDDPAGDLLDERGEAPTDTGTDLLPLPPLYAVDQTSGPLNEREAYRAWQMGIMCSPKGGSRPPL